jgi:hypothetical protein
MNTYGSSNSGLGDNLAHLTMEPQMQVLTECRGVATISGENTECTIAEVSGRELQSRITPPMLQKLASLPPARIVRILEVREQLAKGTYDLDERLDAVLEHLLKAITTLDNTDNRSS